MSNRKIPWRQLSAWLFVGLSAPLAQLAGSSSWLETLLIGGLCLFVCGVVYRTQWEQVRMNRWLCLAEWIWLLAVAGAVARWVEGSWPVGNAYPTVPIVLLILAAVASDAGAEKASRVGGVLLWLVVIVFALVFYAGIREMDYSSIESAVDFSELELIPVFLIPALLIFIPREKGHLPAKALIGILGLGLAFTVWVAGGLSSEVAENVQYPLYERVRSLRQMQISQRFEALVSVVLTMGWFALLSILLSAAGHLSESVRPGWGRRGVWTCAGLAAGSAFIDKWLPLEVISVGCVVGWILLPVINSLFAKIKMKNVETST